MSEQVRAPSWFVALVNRPLVHFLVLGALLVCIRSAIAKPEPSGRIIYVSSAVRAEVRRELEAGLGRKASSTEYEAALRRWKLDEVAYREALRLKLNDKDSVIKRQLINKFFEVNLQLQPLPEPTKRDLDAWFASHRADYVPEHRYDFEQVFAAKTSPDAEQRARHFVRALEQGADPRELGDKFHFGRTFLGRSRDAIEVEFGAAFASRLVELELGRWTVLESKFGWHAVRLNRKSGGRLPSQAQLRRLLYRDFREHARQQLFEQQLRDLEQSYHFVEASP